MANICLVAGIWAVLSLAGCDRDGDREPSRDKQGEHDRHASRGEHDRHATGGERGEGGPGAPGEMVADPTADHDDDACPPGTAGCRCEQGRKGCAAGLECFGGYCYGGSVPAPKTYFYERKQFDDVQVLREQIMASLPIRPGMVVADVGAGHGWFSVRVALAAYPGGRVYATDILKEPLAFLQGFSAGLHHAQRRHAPIEPRHCSGDRDTGLKGVSEGSVDLVLMINSLIFLADPKGRAADLAYLKEIVGLMRPGGMLLLHNDWVFPNAVGRAGMVKLLREAGLTGQVQELVMPAHMPAETFYEERPGGTRRVLRRGFIIGLNKPGGQVLRLVGSVIREDW